MTDPSKQPDSSSTPDDVPDQPYTPTSDTSESTASDQPESPSAPLSVDQPAETPIAADAAAAVNATGEHQAVPPSSQPAEPGAGPAAAPLPEPMPQPAVPQPTVPQPAVPGYTQPVPGAYPPRGNRRGVVVAVTLLAVLLVVLCSVVGYLFLEQMSENNAHQTGQCVTQSDNTAEPADCDDKDAYKIIKRLDNTQSDSGCPPSQTELYFVNESSDYVLCLKKSNSNPQN